MLRHEEAIQANIRELNAQQAEVYDNRASTKALSILFGKMLLEYNGLEPRKSAKQTAEALGDAEQEANGWSASSFLPARASFHELFAHSPFKPGSRIMDFACGTGVVSELIAPYLVAEGASDSRSELVGVDVNPHFLQKFDARARALNDRFKGLLAVRSYLYDVLDPLLLEEIDRNFLASFDAIYCTISYHHIDNYRDVTKKLATFLKPGGWLYIVDFYNEDVEDTDRPSTNSAVRHMGGLRVDSLNSTLRDHAGLSDVSSAREAKVNIWQQQKFIENHCTADTVTQLHSGALPKKHSDVEGDLYLVQASLILASGRRA